MIGQPRIAAALAAIFFVALVLSNVVKKLPEPALVLAAGVTGLALKASGL
jgi:hypothetical protein